MSMLSEKNGTYSGKRNIIAVTNAGKKAREVKKAVLPGINGISYTHINTPFAWFAEAISFTTFNRSFE